MGKLPTKSSSAVAVCKKKTILNDYVVLINKSFDGILTFKLKHKFTKFSTIIMFIFHKNRQIGWEIVTLFLSIVSNSFECTIVTEFHLQTFIY